jgi:hypothetical protein
MEISSGHFMQLLKYVNLHKVLMPPLTLTLLVFSLIYQSRNPYTLAEWHILKIETIMELLEICFRTTYFLVNDKLFRQKDEVTIGCCLSVIISNIFTEHFEKLFSQNNTNRRRDSAILMTYLWSGLMAQSGYRITSVTSIV